MAHVGRHADATPEATATYSFSQIYSEIEVRCPGTAGRTLHDL